MIENLFAMLRDNIVYVAFAKETKPWELLDLLVTSSSLENISSPDYSKENFLSIFFDHCDNPIPLAAIGFYPSIVESSREILYRIKSINSSFTKMEKQLLTAHILSTNLAKLHTNSNLISNENESKEPDSQWIKKTQLNRIQQKFSLQEETSHFISNQLNKLRYALSLDFFLECADACPENRSLKNFIVNKLATEVGTPSEISEAIASIWTQAAQWATNWHVATHSIEEANRFLIHLTRNLLHKKFSNYIADENDLYHQCHDAICDELSITIDPLNNFCSNPVAWLRKCENRSNLRPVDESDLANSLQIELGLPIVTCQAISNAWSKAINLAKKSPQWKSTTELDRLLAIILAQQIEQCFSDDLTRRIIPDQYLHTLSMWVERVKNQTINIDSSTTGRKRPPSGDPEGAPPRKEARS